MNTFELSLDLDKEQGLPQLVTLRQGDKSGTQLVATIYDHGQLVGGSYTARVSLRHPGTGATYYRETATYSGGVATVTVDEQRAATVAGVTTGYFELLQGSTVKASTADFIVRILPSAEDGAVPGEVYDSAIEDALSELDAATGRISQMVVDATAEYLAAHPEITTTVQDNSVTDAKLIQSGGVLDRVGRLWWRLENLLTNTPAEAESVTVSDAAKTPVAGLTVFGKSTQDGTPAPNAPVAIKSVTPNLWRETVHGIGSTWVSTVTITKAGYNRYIVNGTSTGTHWLWGGGGSTDERQFVTLPAGTYTAVLGGADASKFTIAARGLSNGSTVVLSDTGNPNTFTLAESMPVEVVIVTLANITYVDAEVTVQLYAGSSSAPAFAPYGHIGLWSHSRNQLRVTAKSMTQTGITFTVNEDKSITVSGTATANTYFYLLGGYAISKLYLPDGTYRVSGIPSGASAGGYSLVMREVSAARWVTLTSNANISGGSYDNFAIRVMSGTTVNVTFSLQIEQGTTNHAYVPYAESVTPIPLDGHVLRSLPDGTRDEVTVDQYGHVTLVQRVGSYTFDGNENVSGTTSAGAYYTISNLGIPAVRRTQSGASGNCDHYAVVTDYTSSTTPVNSVVINASTFSSVERIMFYDTEHMSNFKAWVTSNPVTLDYALATPVTHDLGTIDPTALVGPDMTAQAVPTAPFALTYERDLNATLARLEAALATLA